MVAFDDFGYLGHVRFGGLFSWFDQGFKTENPPVPIFTRLVFTNLVLSDVKTEEIKPRLFTFQRVGNPRFRGFQFKPYFSQPILDYLLALLHGL